MGITTLSFYSFRISFLFIVSIFLCVSLFSQNKPTISVYTGLSGMVKVGDNSFLGIHDTKNDTSYIRISLIEIISDSGVKSSPIKVLNKGDKWSSDLESVCTVTMDHMSNTGQFILLESGNYVIDKKTVSIGKMYLVEIDFNNLTSKVIKETEIPIVHDTGESQGIDYTGDQYEGCICQFTNPENDNIQIILGERGGSKHYPHGVLKWGNWDLSKDDFQFSKTGGYGLEIKAPGEWQNEIENRDISDLYVDECGIIWASACEDPSDLGAYYSTIYMLGYLTSSSLYPVKLFRDFEVYGEFESIKIETLSDFAEIIDCCSSFTIGIDNEGFGSHVFSVR